MAKIQEERISKLLSARGVCSRREAERLIIEGRVKRNGRLVTIGDKAMPRDLLTVDGIEVGAAPEKVYLMLNKPRGYVTTTHDEHGRKCVTELVADQDARVYPVGRLDRESEGLLLMTNDGEFANLLTHPTHGVTKVYRVTVHPRITPEQEVKLLDGVQDDGELLLARSVTLLDEDEERSVLQIVLTGGKNRQIRRMCAAVGLEIARLKRVSEGGIKLGMLPVGRWRMLEAGELRMLKASLRGETEEARGAAPKRETSGTKGRTPEKTQGNPKAAPRQTGVSDPRNSSAKKGEWVSKSGFSRKEQTPLKPEYKKPDGYKSDKPAYAKPGGTKSEKPSNEKTSRYSSAKPSYDKPNAAKSDRPSYGRQHDAVTVNGRKAPKTGTAKEEAKNGSSTRPSARTTGYEKWASATPKKNPLKNGGHK